MATVSPFMKKIAGIVRRNIRLGRESGHLAIPAGSRVSVVSSPCTGASTIDVTIRNAPDTWILTRDASQNWIVTPEANQVGQRIVDMVREESGDAFGCFVYADDVVLGSWLRR